LERMGSGRVFARRLASGAVTIDGVDTRSRSDGVRIVHDGGLARFVPAHCKVNPNARISPTTASRDPCKTARGSRGVAAVAE